MTAARELGALSEFAARSYATSEDAIDAVLTLLSEQFGMRTSFLARISQDDSQFTLLATHNEPGGCQLVAGESVDLPQTY